ncbi:hypothetical protein FPV67DRAFT_1463320 [Lyophyllum atratum]|nr:hypothetical protein FPV67DRAFT_1463320 [Lyophyllum atratum]
MRPSLFWGHRLLRAVALAVLHPPPRTDPRSPHRISTTRLPISSTFHGIIDVDGRADAVSQFKPRVYLQGVEEATHGLSDTLLSVLGVRAGEVVDDLCNGD